jgi:TonB family protein
MKHFTVRLSDPSRQTRQWSIWADTLTVGSDPRCSLVLPAPVAPRLGAFLRDAILDLPFGRLEVREDTPARIDRWEDARARIARSRMLEWKEPGDKSRAARMAMLVGMGVLSIASMAILVRMGNHPLPMTVEPDLTDLITLTIPEEKKDPPPPKDDPAPAASSKPVPKPVGGPSESHTDPWKTATDPHKDVMDHSVITKLTSQDTKALLGESVEDQTADQTDVFLRGDAGAHMVKGGIGGMASGDNDRMGAVAGIGLGNGGQAGIGLDRGSIAGKLTAGAGGPKNGGVALRARVTAPKPTDVELGGDAGTRSPESILRVIRQGMGGFRYVYEKYLRDNPNLGGKISLRFTIAPSGDIVGISLVASNTGDEKLDASLVDQAKRMKFDQIEKGNVTVTYAFLLDKQ